MGIRIIASEKNWIESAAVEQLDKTAQLSGIIDAVGMPDLHPGKDAPIGAVFASERVIYPHVVGNDIGCGMGLWMTDLSKSKMKLDKLTKQLAKLDTSSDTLDSKFLDEEKLAHNAFDGMLGSIGGGNHFAELQRVKEVFDKQFFESSGLDSDSLFLLVHSGSRRFGEQIHKSQWKRSDCRGRLEKKFTIESLLRTELGGHVICTDRNLLYEEAPQAYKDVDIVVQDLIDAGAIRPLATFAPLITYKTGAIKR